MTIHRMLGFALLAIFLIGAGGGKICYAGEPRQVVTDTEIEARLGQQVHSESADRQAIQDLLRRPQVRQIAGKAGLDLQRAERATNVLSGPELQRIAAQARSINAGIGAGSGEISWTMVIIIVVIVVVILAII